MRLINDYGWNLCNKFVEKSNMIYDIEDNCFLEILFYEYYIVTLKDFVGWLLATYDIYAYETVKEWETTDINNDILLEYPYEDIYKELDKCFY